MNMRFLGILTGGGVGAFFFFSWVIQMLWNSIVVRHLGLLKPLNYWQAAGLWFLITLFLAWTGIGAAARLWQRRRSHE
jgi:Na+-driven multidrug efflux pump